MLTLLVAALLLSPVAVFAAAAPQPLTPADLAGAWTGSLAHEGDSTAIGFGFSPDTSGRVMIEYTLPALHFDRVPLGAPKLVAQGDSVRLGPFRFAFDADRKLLTGTMPAAFFPAYEVHVTLHRGAVPAAPARPVAPASLKPLWTFDGGSPMWAGPAYADGRVHVGTQAGKVFALAAADGRVTWEFRATDAVLAAPAVGGGRVVFGSYDHFVYSLDAATGKLAWKCDTRGRVVSTPALAGDRVVIGNRIYDLLGLDARTGEVAWRRYQWGTWVESSAAVRDGIAYVGSSDGACVSAWQPGAGKQLWLADVGGWSWGQPAVTADRVYAGVSGQVGYPIDNQGALVALDRGTGAVAWRFAAQVPASGDWGFPGSPAVGRDLVYAGGLDGKLYAFAR